MSKQVLFLQGAGEGAYKEDKELVISLRHSLGPNYDVHYPAMPNEDDADYESWKHRIEKELAALQSPVFLIGHSVGGSILIKCLGEIKVKKPIGGIFLIAAPFWSGDGWRYEGYEKLALPRDSASRIPRDARIFLYHGRDDEIVPFAHLALYLRELPGAVIRELDKRGHQLNNDLSEVAEDIKNLD